MNRSVGCRARVFIGRVRRLRVHTVVEVLHVLALAAFVEVGLHIRTLPRLASSLKVDLDFESARGIPLDQPLPAWAVERLAVTRQVMRLLPSEASCLRVSLVCASRLRPLGPKVRIGVAKAEQRLRAHAWVEIAGQYLDAGAEQFQPVHSLVPRVGWTLVSDRRFKPPRPAATGACPERGFRSAG